MNRSSRGFSGSRKSLVRLTSATVQKVQADDDNNNNKSSEPLEKVKKAGFFGSRKSLNRPTSISGRKLSLADSNLSPEPVKGTNEKPHPSPRNSDSRKKSLLARSDSEFKELDEKRRLSFASLTKQFHSTLEFETSDKSLVEERLSVDRSKSSDEIEGTEKVTEVHERIIDFQGVVKLITRRVKTFEKNKNDIQKSSEPSVEDIDEYEEIEEEVDEEIEVEEEEVEEEEAEEFEEGNEEYIYGKKVDEHIIKDEEIDEAMTELEQREVEEIEEQDLSMWDKSEKEETDGEEIIQEGSSKSSADLEVAEKEANVLKEKKIEPKGEAEDLKEEGEDEGFQKMSIEIKKEVAHEHELAEEIESKRSMEEIEFERKKSPVKRKCTTKTIRVIKIVRKKKKKENIVFPEEDIAIQQQPKLEEKKKVVPIEQDDKLIEMVKIKVMELNRAKAKNKMLQKSIIDFCRQKRIDFVYEMASTSTDSLRKYNKKLKLLEKMINTTSVEKNRITTEINMMKEIMEKYEKQYSKELSELFRWERELGRSVTDSISGKPIDEKILVNLIQRHEAVLKQLSETRLKMIKVFNNFSSRQNALKKLICVGENLSLIDFEQLRLENQIFADKIEERDEELSCLKRRMIAIFHTYAHVLEKCNLILDDIEISEIQLNSVNQRVSYFREQVSGLKQLRDGLRISTSKMKKSAGLLIRPSLAVDFENSLKKLKEGKIKLQEIIKLFNVQRSEILKLRKAHSDSSFLL